MAITPTSITPTQLVESGVVGLTIVGDFSAHLGQLFRVYIGPSGDDTDELCLSGKSGRPHEVYPLNATKLKCFAPLLVAGGPYSVYLKRVDAVDNGVLVDVISVVKDPYYTKVFDYRSPFPPHYKVGPRAMNKLGAV